MSVLRVAAPTSPLPLKPSAAGRRRTAPDRDAAFLADVLAGLGGVPKTLPCKYLYDARGSALFDRICELPEYYPTRTETAILRERLDEIAACLPAGAVLIEYGSGSSSKTRLLLDRLDDLAAYVPVDISESHLLRSAWQLRARYPRLNVRPVCADFTRSFPLPRFPGLPRVVFFPGSTIGNFGPDDATELLAGMASVVGTGGGLLIGVDLRKPPEILEPAYDDAAGVTAEFNRNLLRRINRELGGTFDLDRFAHRAVFNAAESRVEMHRVSLGDQVAEVAGVPFRFASGETIHTENSYKYGLDDFATLAARAGWRVERAWTDPRELFSVQYLVAE